MNRILFNKSFTAKALRLIKEVSLRLRVFAVKDFSASCLRGKKTFRFRVFAFNPVHPLRAERVKIDLVFLGALIDATIPIPRAAPWAGNTSPRRGFGALLLLKETL